MHFMWKNLKNLKTINWSNSSFFLRNMMLPQINCNFSSRGKHKSLWKNYPMMCNKNIKHLPYQELWVEPHVIYSLVEVRGSDLYEPSSLSIAIFYFLQKLFKFLATKTLNEKIKSFSHTKKTFLLDTFYFIL